MQRSIEESLLLRVNGLRSPALDPVLSWLNEWGFYVLPLVMIALALRTRRRSDVASARDGWLAFLGALFLSESVIKPLVHRLRPTGVPSLAAQLHVLGPVPSRASLSFPSGTASACVAAAAFIWLAWGRRAGIPAVLFAALISIGRLYIGVHWPSDLVAGALLGAGVAYGLWRLSRWAASTPPPPT